LTDRLMALAFDSFEGNVAVQSGDASGESAPFLACRKGCAACCMRRCAPWCRTPCNRLCGTRVPLGRAMSSFTRCILCSRKKTALAEDVSLDEMASAFDEIARTKFPQNKYSSGIAH
jgi:hypothetical protein